MDRREFGKLAVMGAGAGLVPVLPLEKGKKWRRRRRTIKPARLSEGDTVGLIAPGSPFSEEQLEKALENLDALGLKVRKSTHLRGEMGYLAGPDRGRLLDIHAMFADPGIDAVWCIRGGYGCGRLLPYLNYKLIRKNPKVLIGYSDVTALHQAIHRNTGLVTFHGPVASSDMTDYTLAHLRAVIFDAADRWTVPLAPQQKPAEEMEFEPTPLYPGKAEGELTGGNLSLLTALAGTPYLDSFKDRIVFIEDIGEKPYRIDRMLTQLRQATDLDRAAGIMLGEFVDCHPEDGDRSLSLKETIYDRLLGLELPAVFGLSFGHVDNQCTLPMGIRAGFDADDLGWTMLENAVT